MLILVTGGTGVLGRHVVRVLRERGHVPRVLSRRPPNVQGMVRGDLATGAGLSEAVAGVDGIIHAASATTEPWRYRSTDVAGTGRLLEAARAAAVPHLLYISIAGMEGIPYPYYRYKLRAETLVREGGVPWSILRATQFPELIEVFLGGFSLVPGLILVPYEWRFQVVHAAEVAVRLVDVVEGAPAGRVPDFGGPAPRRMEDLARSWRNARHSRRRIARLPLAGRVHRAFSAGRLLVPDGVHGTRTWEDWLGERYGHA